MVEPGDGRALYLYKVTLPLPLSSEIFVLRDSFLELIFVLSDSTDSCLRNSKLLADMALGLPLISTWSFCPKFRVFLFPKLSEKSVLGKFFYHYIYPMFYITISNDIYRVKK